MNFATLSFTLPSPRGRFLAAVCAIGILFLTPHCSVAQRPAIARRPLEHKDYDVWKTISSRAISRDGRWAMYQVQNGSIDGESVLQIRSTATAKEFAIERGSAGRFSYDSRFAVFLLTPEKETVKKLKKENAKPEQMPKAKLQILELATGSYESVDRVASFDMPEENAGWIGYRLEKSLASEDVIERQSETRETYEVTVSGLQRPKKEWKLKKREMLQPPKANVVSAAKAKAKANASEPESESKQPKAEADSEEAEEKEKTEGTTFVLRNLDSGIQQAYPKVLRFAFSKNGRELALVTSVKAEKADSKNGDREKSEVTSNPVDGVAVIDLQSLGYSQVAVGTGQYKGLAFNEDGTQLAFITNTDDYDAKTPGWSVQRWTKGQKKSETIAHEGTDGIPHRWWVATNSSQRFSEDGRRLYFETAPIPESVIKEREDAQQKRKGEKDADEEDDEDQVKLDVWHWQDPFLQPQQLIQAEAERNRDYQAVYNSKSKRTVQLATPQIPFVQIDYRSKSTRAIAVTDVAYRKVLSWESPGFQDTYLVSLDSGKHELVQQRVRWDARLSPEGKFIYWFDAEQRKWFTQLASGRSKPVNVTGSIGHPLDDELHDRPSLPYAYGTAGWTKEDQSLLVYDRFDIWQVDPTGKKAAIRLSEGREQKIRFRYQRLDAKERCIDLGHPIVLNAFNEKTKASGYYRLTLDRDAPKLRPLIMLPESVTDLKKAESTDDVIFTRSTFEMCPDLWSSTLEFNTIDRVSEINPQQEDYAWGTAELVQWKSTDGQELDGILYRPDGFDPEKQYPMLVYFYERSSDRLNRYHAPAAGRASINVSFYVSRGYVVFIPDIPYKVGAPGNSAAGAILPGVQSVVDKGFIDKNRIGMQGHSWGGYQTAYLVTQTNLFACAESGAPVSNMTSAYGGIRWSSGRSRMFQYERTQSRIGDNLWSARDKYIANSPLFFADKINTPLLILHNDQDGAVPWYQGIELFVALRRLEKPAWMLNYNGNSHGVDGQPNRRDFAIRMQQFFDHYLKDAPEPEWMAVGVPAVKKGEELGLELLEPAKVAE